MIAKKKDQFLQKYGYIAIFLVALLVFLFYPNVGIYDWDKEILYTSYIKTSLLEFKQFPLFLWNSDQLAGYPAVDQSAFFAANPETMLFSPFLPLLFFLPPEIFLKLLVVLNGIVGIAGLLLLGKKLRWQPDQTRIFSALFLLSPIVIQHVAIGYLPWINLFLFPWLLYFLLSEDMVSHSLGSGMVLAVVLLQGGSHIFVWMAFFVVFFELCSMILKKRIEHLISILLIFIAAVLLALPRFYLSMQSFASFSQRFFSGYSVRAFLQWGLIPPFFTPASMDDIEFFIEGYIDGVPYWDGELFWGAMILLAVLLPFYFLYMKKQKKQLFNTKNNSLAVAAASFILWILSLENFYERIVTFFSELLRLPALEGMEKYPFRLAILAYYGFAFVIAHSWLDLPDFFTEAGAECKRWLEKAGSLFVQFCGWLKKHHKSFRQLTVILMGLTLIVILIQPVVLSWLHAQITLAYSGGGLSWLTERMEKAGSIPLDRYLAKASTLYKYIQHLILGLAAVSVVIWLLGMVTIWQPKKRKIQKTQSHFPLWVVEVLLMVPLLLAFGMWWRVSFATPQNTTSVLEMKAPVIISEMENDPAKVEILSCSPLSINLNSSGVYEKAVFILDGIPYADARFLKIQPDCAKFINWDGKLGIQLEQDGELTISVDQNYVLIPSAVALCAWLLCGGILLKKKQK